jgi:hypothetical protein
MLRGHEEETNVGRLDISESPAKVPKNTIGDMLVSGATVKEVEENLFSISNVNYGDQAWLVYQKWAMKCKADPRVGAGFFPPGSIINTALVPHSDLVHHIQIEANSIITHYSDLRMEDFEGENDPELPDPLPAPEMMINIHHASIAVSKLMQTIQNPPGNYPTIRGLKAGSYICTVNQQWSNVGVTINIFRP